MGFLGREVERRLVTQISPETLEKSGIQYKIEVTKLCGKNED